MTGSATLPATGRLLDLVDQMAGRPVVMLVDLVADLFITGTPKRISREAPVLILRYEGERLAPGGGANAVANVAALGGRPLLLGLVGDDEHGRGLLAALAARGVATDGVLVRPGYRTPTKVRILGGGRSSIKQQIVRYDIEESLALSAAERATLAARLAAWGAAATGARVAVLSDYGYGTVEPGLLPEVRAAVSSGASGVSGASGASGVSGASGASGVSGASGFSGVSCVAGSAAGDPAAGSADTGATVVCDSRYRLGDFAGLDGATPNEEEAEALLGGPLEEREPLEQAGQLLRERLGARFLLITRGSRGMSLFRPGEAAHLPVSGTDQVADVTGAGDTVIGAFALALAAGADPLEAALLSNYAGGVVVMKMGTATLTPEELKHAIRADPRPLEELRWAKC